MYIDLVRAYLIEYGSQVKLARALGVTEAFLSFVLTSPASVGSDRWDSGLRLPAEHLAEELRQLKTPSQRHAAAIVEVLCTDEERREVLRYHLEAARAGPVLMSGRLHAAFDQDDVSHVMNELRRTHAVALHGVEPDHTREAYARVWEIGIAAVGRIDSGQWALDLVQLLLYLHDAASVLDRHDLGLGYARIAQLLLAETRQLAVGDLADRYRLNVVLAEAVSLNNLGLWRRAHIAAQSGMASRGAGTIEPDQWQRSFLEQQLTAMAASRRLSVYEAESIANRAWQLVPDDPLRRAGVTVRLANTYLAQGTPRSVRKASRLLADLTHMLGAESRLSPLRRIQVLRALIRVSQASLDLEAERRWRLDAAAITTAAGFTHQGRLV